jgi:hypothetical protein
MGDPKEKKATKKRIDYKKGQPPQTQTRRKEGRRALKHDTLNASEAEDQVASIRIVMASGGGSSEK